MTVNEVPLPNELFSATVARLVYITMSYCTIGAILCRVGCVVRDDRLN
jgi:hypothetical protein